MRGGAGVAGCLRSMSAHETRRAREKGTVKRGGARRTRVPTTEGPDDDNDDDSGSAKPCCSCELTPCHVFCVLLLVALLAVGAFVASSPSVTNKLIEIPGPVFLMKWFMNTRHFSF